MNILVLGAGMYVTGRNGTGNGTILSSLCELSREIKITSVTIASRTASSAAYVYEAAAKINKILGTDLSVMYFCINNDEQYEKLFNNKYAAAIVAVPDNLHYSFIRKLLHKKIPTLVVKPFVETTDKALDLINIQKATGTYGAVEFHKRWDQTNLKVKNLIAEGRFGDLLYCVVEYSQRISIPTKTFASWADESNIFQYLGVHYVDLFYFLTGFQPVRISAVGTNGALRQKGINTWDSVHATIIWQSPADKECVQHISCNWVDPEGTSALSDQKYTLVGTCGRIDIDQKKRGMELVLENSGTQELNPYFSEYLADPDGRIHFTGYGFESIKQFIIDVKAIEQGITNRERLEGIRPTFTEALVSTKVVEAGNISLNSNGEWIKIP